MLPTTRWIIADEKLPERIYEYSSNLSVLPIISTMLINRGVSDVNEGRRFLSPSLKDLHNPFLMRDMEEAVSRILRAVAGKEHIVVYGDYDADGITATAILVLFLRSIGASVSYYIPDRITEGYGLNLRAIGTLKERGCSLIVTVDCGVSDFDEVAYATSLGVDCIVVDHHEVPSRLPAAVAVINPHREDCSFPCKYLAGAGVAFNVLIALRSRLRAAAFWDGRPYPNLKDYLDLVALGTIGDLVPLVDENRIFAKVGLDVLSKTSRPGLRALKRRSGADRSILTAEVLSFALIPRINAAGRMGTATAAVELLLTKDEGQAAVLTERLESYNQRRKEVEIAILESVVAAIERDPSLGEQRSFVFASKRWHPGVIGIVASKLVDRYYRPTVLFCLKDGIGRGSGRSIEEFNLFGGISKRCAPFLVTYGGHQYAAGCTIREENIDLFSQALEGAIREDLGHHIPLPTTHIDGLFDISGITTDLLNQIDLLSPFGPMNPEPLLCMSGVKAQSLTLVGNNHLKMQLANDEHRCDSIWFSKGEYGAMLRDAMLSIVYTPQINEWNGERKIQLKVRDVRIMNP
ncbi:MAG: single-stranded-DNA-specific exonuclease RecJ [Deltaproteobacteria bacterium]|nr:single-stranded-DNA-specific exonuclease RecJ [Deltaproteobacteria bacterium]